MICRDIKNLESIDFNKILLSTEDKSFHSNIFSSETITYGNNSTKSLIASYRWIYLVAHRRFNVLTFESKSLSLIAVTIT
jgi:hypothetical protein